MHARETPFDRDLELATTNATGWSFAALQGLVICPGNLWLNQARQFGYFENLNYPGKAQGRLPEDPLIEINMRLFISL